MAASPAHLVTVAAAFAAGIYYSFSSPHQLPRSLTNYGRGKSERQEIMASKKKLEVSFSPQFDGLHCYETPVRH